MCSRMYSYSFATQPDWTKRYAPWSEIQQYILKVTEQYGLRPISSSGREVVSAVFSEANGRWVIKTASGDTLMARHWVLASGPLHVPLHSQYQGLERLPGRSCTRPSGIDYDLTGKTVASIGMAAAPFSTCRKSPQGQTVASCFSARRGSSRVTSTNYSAFSKWLFRALPVTRTLYRWRCYWTNEFPRLAHLLTLSWPMWASSS